VGREGLRGARRSYKSIYIEMITRSAFKVAECCARLNIHCRDPPAVTTSTLYGLGYNQYQVRSFWEWARESSPMEATLYQSRGALFRIVAIHSTGALREYPCSDGIKIPLDELDSRRLYYEYAPNAHKLYIYVEGGYGGVGLKVNVERLMSILARVDETLLNTLANAIVKEAWGRTSESDLEEHVWALINKWRDALSMILPSVPHNRESMTKYMPLLRRRA
jgi:hypothetical protein